MDQQKKTAIDLSETSEIYKAIIEHIGDSVILLNRNYIVLRFNHQAKKNLIENRKKELYIGADFREFIYPDQAELFYTSFNSAINGNPHELETGVKNEYGNIHWFRSKSLPVYNNDKNVTGVVLISSNLDERKSAETALKISESNFRSAFEHSATGMALVSPEGKLLRVNPEFCHIIGFREDEILSAPFSSFTHPDDIKKDLSFVKDAIDGKLTTYKTEKRYIHKNKSIVWVALNSSLVKDAIGKPLYFVTQINDISSRKLSEQKLEKYNHELTLLNNINDIILCAENQNELFKVVCECIVERGGYKLAWVGMRPKADDKEQYVVPEFAHGKTGYLKDIQISLNDEKLSKGPTATVLRTGKTVITNNVSDSPNFKPWLEKAGKHGISSSIVLPLNFSETGKVDATLNIYSEKIDAFDTAEVKILERVAKNISLAVRSLNNQAEIEKTSSFLRERDEQFKLFFEHSPAALAMLDTEMRYMLTSKSWIKDYNLKQEDIIGKSHYEVFPTIPQNWKDVHQRCLKGAYEKSDLDWFTDENGNVIYNRWNIRPWYKASGEIGGIIMFTQVITEMVESEMKFKDLVEKSQVGVFIMHGRKLAYTNPRITEIFGYDADELIGMEATEFIHESFHSFIEKNYQRRLSGENQSFHYEAIAVCKNKKEIWVEVFSNSTQYKGRQAIIGTVIDITDRKIAEEKLKQSEANLSSVFDNTNVGHLLLDKDYNVIASNNTFNQRFRDPLHIDFVMNNNFLAWLSPERREVIKNHFQKVITEMEPFEYEVNYSFENDPSVVNFNVSLSPVLDKEKLIGFCLSAYDNTKRKMMEVERQQIINDLLQRNKDLEQFAYMLSHNLRAPLANIKGAGDILCNMQLDETERAEYTTGLYDAVLKLDNVIEDMNTILYVKKNITENYENINLAKIIDEVKASIHEQIKQEKVEIECNFEGFTEIYSLRTYIYSIFHNLISNSIKYRRADASPVIKITTVKTDNKLAILFRDNCSGINMDRNKDKVFGLYNRFHKNIDGKGMGLYMVKTQVETLRGKISLTSEVNKGTEFLIEFKPDAT